MPLNAVIVSATTINLANPI